MNVSAIIITFNSAKTVGDCLSALEREITAVGGEIIVYDNISRDDTAAVIKNKFPELNLHVSPRNVGFGAANNAAAALASGDYLLLANPDMVLDSGALKILLDSIRELPEAGAVVARLRNADGSFQPTCRNFPNFYNIFFSRGSVLNHRGLARKAGHTYTIDEFDLITAVPAASAACMLINRDLFLKLGGFDPRFFLFMEDTDLSLRINQAGKKIYFIPQAGAMHHWGKGSSIGAVRRSFYHHFSVWKYYLKHYPNGFSLFLLPAALTVNFFLRMVFGNDRH